MSPVFIAALCCLSSAICSAWALTGAGAASSVLIHWKVDFAATAFLMVQFHTELKKTQTPAAALRTAALATIKQPFCASVLLVVVCGLWRRPQVSPLAVSRTAKFAYNTPMRMLGFAVFFLYTALAVQAQPPDGSGGAAGTGAGTAPGAGGAPPGGRGRGGRGGGGGGKNIQVLQGADLPATMQSFVQALGLLDKGTCSYCHVEDRSSDAKIEKVTARRMIIMMRGINGTFGDGKQHVTCFTCHRGSPTPLTEP
jgi:photosynthetic reaction center cytochrome c subunit